MNARMKLEKFKRIFLEQYLVLTIFSVIAAMLILFMTGLAIFNTKITISDGERTIHVLTEKEEVDDILIESGFTLGDYDVVTLGSRNNDELSEIIINRAFEVPVTADGKTVTVFATSLETVGYVLDKADITIDDDDIINVNVDALVEDGTEIVIQRVVRKVETKTSAIPFETEYTTSSFYKRNTENTVTEGEEGELTTVSETTYIDGVLSSFNVISEEVTKEPVNEVIATGTAKRTPWSTAKEVELDENGIPETAEGRIAIAKKIIATAESYGIDKKNLVVDALTMTISTDGKNAVETLKAVSYIRNTLGVNTVLGVSNISFGLPNREAVNTAFYTLAMNAGLSAGIINPNSKPMMNAFYSYKALAGLDENCEQYIRSAAPIEVVTSTNEVDRKQAIIKGMKEESARCAENLLKSTEPLEIINTYIIPALDVVGDGFEKNTLFLPQLLMSADSAKAAFDKIKAHIVSSGTPQVKGEKIIIATVEGDIHDIGKNIVKVLLQNYGFDVIDLGKDVKCETVLEEAIKNDVKLVGLSALMTTTVPNMEKTIKLLHDNTDAKVFVGGAVLTRDYAKMINADWYAKDAMESVRIAQEFFD